MTGLPGLVKERRSQLYPGLPASQAWRGSTLKAIAINTCDDVGAEGPDYRMGYGLANARSAVLAVDADHDIGRGSLIKEFSLAPSESVSWVVQSDGTVPFSGTATWSDPPGPALTTISGPDPQNPMLVNNIDLKVEYLGPDTETYPPPSVVVASYLPWVLDPDLTGKSATVRGQAATRGVDQPQQRGEGFHRRACGGPLPRDGHASGRVTRQSGPERTDGFGGAGWCDTGASADHSD